MWQHHALDSMDQITLTAVRGIPLIRPGDDLTGIMLAMLKHNGIALRSGDVLAFTSKIVSKAEGRFVKLAEVIPTARAHWVAAQCHKDPRLVQVILDESESVSRVRPGLLIVRHRLGFVCANAGVDCSNVSADNPAAETVLLLPADPDASAGYLRQQIEDAERVHIGVVIVDSHGRPHRMGAVGVAVGAAGVPALQDWRGEPDLFGHPLASTEVGLADEIASAASLLFGQAAGGLPVVLVRGVPFELHEGCAGELIRPRELDLFQ
jgi:coenzyme F420-0:L-glutamate ligase/coenzyme F420-1:gamma-L-glutamate ligase